MTWATWCSILSAEALKCSICSLRVCSDESLVDRLGESKSTLLFSAHAVAKRTAEADYVVFVFLDHRARRPTRKKRANETWLVECTPRQQRSTSIRATWRFSEISNDFCSDLCVPHWRRFRLTTDMKLCGTDKLQQESLTPEIRPERQRAEGLMESILHPAGPTCATVVMMTARRRRNCLIYVNPPDLPSQVDGNVVCSTTVFLNCLLYRTGSLPRPTSIYIIKGATGF